MRVAPQEQAPDPQQAQGAPQGQSQGPSPQEAIQMVETGFKALGEILQKSGQSLPPEDIQLFQAAAKATDAFIQAIMSPEGQGGPQPQEPQGPSQPMAANDSPRGSSQY